MAKATLPTNFKDDILDKKMGGRRRYKMTTNSDGTVTLEDVKACTQSGYMVDCLVVKAMLEG